MEITTLLEIVGIVAFTLVGVLVGVEYELDVFGIYAVSFCSSLAGGIIRDVCIGRIPPIALTNYVYSVTVIFTVTIALIFLKLFESKINRNFIKTLKRYINFFDAIGLGMFTVSGCQTVVDLGYGDNIMMMIFVGVITAIGGGVLRDLLASRKPVVMRKDLYAIISILGSIAYFYIYPHVSTFEATYLIASLITMFRLVAYWKKINMEFSVTNIELKKDEDDYDDEDDGSYD
jgi:uncharacterized membrane protein YeiH